MACVGDACVPDCWRLGARIARAAHAARCARHRGAPLVLVVHGSATHLWPLVRDACARGLAAPHARIHHASLAEVADRCAYGCARANGSTQGCGVRRADAVDVLSAAGMRRGVSVIVVDGIGDRSACALAEGMGAVVDAARAAAVRGVAFVVTLTSAHAPGAYAALSALEGDRGVAAAFVHAAPRAPAAAHAGAWARELRPFLDEALVAMPLHDVLQRAGAVLGRPVGWAAFADAAVTQEPLGGARGLVDAARRGTSLADDGRVGMESVLARVRAGRAAAALDAGLLADATALALRALGGGAAEEEDAGVRAFLDAVRRVGADARSVSAREERLAAIACELGEEVLAPEDCAARFCDCAPSSHTGARARPAYRACVQARAAAMVAHGVLWGDGGVAAASPAPAGGVPFGGTKACAEAAIVAGAPVSGGLEPAEVVRYALERAPHIAALIGGGPGGMDEAAAWLDDAADAAEFMDAAWRDGTACDGGGVLSGAAALLALRAPGVHAGAGARRQGWTRGVGGALCAPRAPPVRARWMAAPRARVAAQRFVSTLEAFGASARAAPKQGAGVDGEQLDMLAAALRRAEEALLASGGPPGRAQRAAAAFVASARFAVGGGDGGARGDSPWRAAVEAGVVLAGALGLLTAAEQDTTPVAAARRSVAYRRTHDAAASGLAAAHAPEQASVEALASSYTPPESGQAGLKARRAWRGVCESLGGVALGALFGKKDDVTAC